MIGPNEIEKMAKEKPDECFLKGSGILKLTNGIRELEGQVRASIMIEQNLNDRIAELERQNAELRKGIEAVSHLINESEGVSGLHKNGDFAPWDELREGGHYEAWLIDFDAAQAPQREQVTDARGALTETGRMIWSAERAFAGLPSEAPQERAAVTDAEIDDIANSIVTADPVKWWRELARKVINLAQSKDKP